MHNSSSIEPYHDGYHNTSGRNFDPTTRMFSRDELRPQPIIKKKQKVSKPFFQKKKHLEFLNLRTSSIKFYKGQKEI